MTKWQPAKILYLILSIMLTFSIVPFVPFAINNFFASQGAFNVYGLLYDLVGVIISLTILARVQKDNFKPTGALLGFVTYALAVMGQFLFFRYGQESLYASQFYPSMIAGTLFSFVVILAMIVWVFNLFALVFSYLNTFNQPKTTRSKKTKTAQKMRDHSTEKPDVVSEQSRQTVEANARNRESYNNIDPLRYKTMADNNEVTTDKINEQMAKQNNTEQVNDQILERPSVTSRISEPESTPRAEQEVIVNKTTTTTKKKEKQTNGTRNKYVAQLTGDLFATGEHKTQVKKTLPDATHQEHDKKQPTITADELDDE